MVQSAASLKMSAARGAAESYAPHLCNAYPELYPVGGPPLDAGLIHNTAAYHTDVLLARSPARDRVPVCARRG